jgi:hypothetical protein
VRGHGENSMSDQAAQSWHPGSHLEEIFDRDVLAPMRDFQDPSRNGGGYFQSCWARSSWSWSPVAVE